MKLSKTSWLFLAIGLFIITFAGLGAVRSQQAQQQNQLDEKLTSAELKLNGFQIEQLVNQQGELERQLSQTISQSETARDILSQPIGSIAISEILFDIAEANSVEITEISSSGPASEELAGVTLSVLPLTARVKGSLPNLVSFITSLNDDLPSGVVKSVAISIPETTGAEASTNIQLVIYTYQGG